MALDFSDFFRRYEAIIAEADQVFNTVKERFAQNVRCEKGCSDCCHALFDLTLVEALYLNANFLERFSGREKSAVLERADEADRLVHRLKREAFKAVREGAGSQEILAQMAKVRVRCPLLDDEGACVMYDKRPVTCRIYGVPTAIGGQAHTCGKSGFEQGKAYPTVYLDRIQDKLYALSHELAGGLGSRYKELGEMLVPPSLALMTEYTEEYLGLGPAPKEEQVTLKEPPIPRQAPSAPAKAPARPRAQAAPKAKPGKGLPACSGCSPEKKPGGCAGCSPTTMTIGQAPARKPAAKKAPAKKAAAGKAKG